MNIDSLLGVWTGTAHNNNGWDMKITLSVLQPVEIGSMLGVFDIPLIPCSGVETQKRPVPVVLGVPEKVGRDDGNHRRMAARSAKESFWLMRRR